MDTDIEIDTGNLLVQSQREELVRVHLLLLRLSVSISCGGLEIRVQSIRLRIQCLGFSVSVAAASLCVRIPAGVRV